MVNSTEKLGLLFDFREDVNNFVFNYTMNLTLEEALEVQVAGVINV